LAAGVALTAAACLRASASASARFAASDSGLRSGADAPLAGGDGLLVISRLPSADLAAQVETFHL
jgi:hypothetical protein